MTNLCQFVPAGAGRQFCPVCQKEIRLPPRHKVRRVCRPSSFITPPPDPTKQHCVHLGEHVGLVECATCSGKVKRKTFRCAAGHGDVTLVDCKRCSDYQPFGPSRVTRVRLPENVAFNGAIFDQDGLRICWREKWAGSNLSIGDLYEGHMVRHAHQLEIEHPLCRGAQEDPRMFWHNERWHIGFCGVEMQRGKIIAHQLVARLTPAGTAVEEVWYPEHAGRAEWEKNWGWFEWEEQLHCVYTISPHVVLKGERTLERGYVTPWEPRWSGGLLRGGASPVLVGDEYWSFFHGSLDRPGTPRRVYSLGLYVFEAKPPFRPLWYTPEPLMWPDESTRPPNLAVSVVFPCGAVRRGDSWLVSMGVHDRWIDIAEFEHAGLKRVLVKA